MFTPAGVCVCVCVCVTSVGVCVPEGMCVSLRNCGIRPLLNTAPSLPWHIKIVKSEIYSTSSALAQY